MKVQKFKKMDKKLIGCVAIIVLLFAQTFSFAANQSKACKFWKSNPFDLDPKLVQKKGCLNIKTQCDLFLGIKVELRAGEYFVDHDSFDIQGCYISLTEGVYVSRQFEVQRQKDPKFIRKMAARASETLINAHPDFFECCGVAVEQVDLKD